MKKILLTAVAISVLFSSAAFAQAIKRYPISGTTVEVDSQYVVVDGDGKKLHMTRDGSTQISGDLVVGDKVTVEYVVIAKDIKITTPAKKPEPVKVEPPKAEVKPVAPAAATPPKVETPKPVVPEVKAPEVKAPETKNSVKPDDDKVEAPNAFVPSAKETGEKVQEKSGGIMDKIFKQ